MRTQTRNRLQKHGIDIEQLESDFVSHQTVNRHLKRCLGAERDPTDRDDDPIETGTQRIAALQHRTVAVTENTFSQLQAAGELATGDIDVFVDITVSCPECGCTLPFVDSSITTAVTVRSPLFCNYHSNVTKFSVLCNRQEFLLY
jgi:hypothetical protein